jgi:hypothetical protein
VEYSYETTKKGNKKIKQATNTYVWNRKKFMQFWKQEMEGFKDHSDHVKYHKEQMKILFKQHEKELGKVICRWDFAENFVHENGCMVSSEHYGKEQSQLLIVSYWYHKASSTLKNPQICLKYQAFVSDYTVFFKKCLEIFIQKITTSPLIHKVEEIHILTDGARQHFVNRRGYNNISLISFSKGKKKREGKSF